MLVATIIAPPGGAARLREQATAVGPHVDRINLVLPAERALAPWMAQAADVTVLQAAEYDARMLGISAGDFCFFMGCEVDYPDDYVARMVAAYGHIRLDRKIVGVRGTIYSDFFDGSQSGRLVYDFSAPLNRPEPVNQLSLASAACRGSDIADFVTLDLSAANRELTFAVQARRRGVPLICIARGTDWLVRSEQFETRVTNDAANVHAAQEIAGFGRLPVHVLDGSGRIPLHGEPSDIVRGPLVRKLNDDLPANLLNPATAILPTECERPRMAVICCSLGHNPLGRAYTLAELAARDYDVEIIGTYAPRFGRELWKPLRNAAIPIRGVVASDIAALSTTAKGNLLSGTYDVVIASKPRLSSVFLGMALALRTKAPLLLDVDDWELGFVRHHAPLSWSELMDETRHGSPQLQNPTSELWTRYCDTLTEIADAITVSGEALQARYGGTVIAHARDERKFVRDESRRRDMRRALGFSPEQKVILFLGTARDHKGLVRIAKFVAARANEKLVLCVIGANPGDVSPLQQHDSRFVRLFGPQPFDMLADFVSCGDAVCLLQDLSHPAAAYQMPAKIGEALAMGLPLLVNSAPPFADLIANEAAIAVDSDAALEGALDRLLHGELDAPSRQAALRDTFVAQFSQTANIVGLRKAVDLARATYPQTSEGRLARFQSLNMLIRRFARSDLSAKTRLRQPWFALRNRKA